MKLVCKSGKEITIRSLQSSDGAKLFVFFTKISNEKTFILWQGQKVTLEDEIKFAKNSAKEIKENKRIHLVAESNNEIIGGCDIKKNSLALHHTGEMGIVIAADYRGLGIGKKLMQTVITEAQKKWKDLKILKLDVFGNNTTAQNLYKKLGFVECGKIPKGVYYRGRLVDRLTMFKQLR